MPLLADHIRASCEDRDLVVVAPDAGRVKTAEKMAGVLGAPLAFLHKRRSRTEAHKVEMREVVGEVEDRVCVLIDDMIDTAGTIVQGAEVLMASGAARVTAAATHGIFSGPAIDRLKNAPIGEVVVTNTLPLARTSGSTRSACCRWPASSPTPSGRCSRTPASPRSSTTRTSSEPFGSSRASMLG